MMKRLLLNEFVYKVCHYIMRITFERSSISDFLKSHEQFASILRQSSLMYVTSYLPGKIDAQFLSLLRPQSPNQSSISPLFFPH